MRAERTGPGAPPAGPGSRARYVAIVSDGSARWAHAHGVPLRQGHDAAADTVLERVSDAITLGIRELTLYAFSTENWGRPAGEVTALLSMLARRIGADTPTLAEQGVRVRFIGRRDRATEELACAMAASETRTRANTTIDVNVAVDYGGRDEILRAAGQYTGGGEEHFAALLGCPGMHDPDLVIRTSGEQRLSNFLLWQSAYSELVFRSELWPDFSRRAFEECLAEYESRLRRFGGRENHRLTGEEPPRIRRAPERARVRRG